MIVNDGEQLVSFAGSYSGAYITIPQTLNLSPEGTQRLQYPLIKEYSLNHTRDPTII